ncbi:MAG: lipoxygenase family protein [Planctomycetota bacterium]
MTKFIPRIASALGGLFHPDRVSLPQDDPRRDERQRALAAAQGEYQYSYSHVSPLAVCAQVPIHSEFSFGWLAIVAERVLVGLANRAQLEISTDLRAAHEASHKKLTRLLLGGLSQVHEIKQLVTNALNLDVRVGASHDHAQQLSDYAALFRTIGLPGIVNRFTEDAMFARMRLAGPNPLMIRRLEALDERLPITESLFQVAAPGDSLAAALAEARLYLADYAVLDGAPTSSYPNGQKYLAAPLALFVARRTDRQLMPVAIQIQQRPGPQNPIFTPRDGWNWQIAKSFVEIADGNIHEAMMHLGRTHLTMEPFVISTYRQFSAHHPLHVLLHPHFEGTLAINQAAWQHLIAERGAVEKLFSADLSAAHGLSAAGVQQQAIMNSLLPLTFAERGVADRSALPDYPYRDDALLYWQAIHSWVDSYIQIYYPTAAQITGDQELQAWVRELSAQDGGRLNGLPNQGQAIRSAQELVDLLTFVIYTCSVQHAAVNFPQYDLMSYAPNLPLAAYRPPPTTTTGGTEADFLATLPTLDMAELQLELGFLLGTVHYSELGAYSTEHFHHDARVKEPLKQFQKQLADAGSEIEQRNQQRAVPYETLAPAGIPQSINI